MKELTKEIIDLHALAQSLQALGCKKLELGIRLEIAKKLRGLK